MARSKRYRLFIDESGDHTYKNLEETGRRYLGLLGCIINDETYESSVRTRINELKTRHFETGVATVLHRTDIMNRRGPFAVLENELKASVFDLDLVDLLGELRYGLICTVIDKHEHLRHYPRTAFPPYNYGISLMLERYCYFLNRYHCIGDVMAEKRGKTEDRQLQEAFSAVYEGGTDWHPAAFFQSALTSREIKFRDKSANINGLQLADLLAHPIRIAVLDEFDVIEPSDGPFGQSVRTAVADKYNRNFETGDVRGYGMIYKGELPDQ